MPLSGTVYALAAHLLAREYWAQTEFKSTRVAPFANTVATAIMRVDLSARAVVRLLARRCAATGQKVKPTKGVLIAVGRDVDENEVIVGRRSEKDTSGAPGALHR